MLRRPHPVPGHYVDLDEFTTAYVEQWPLIALRRSPVADRPPSNYALAYRGRWYDVWRRTGPAPLRHVPAPSCASIRSLGAQHPLVAARRALLGVYDIASAPLPAGWSHDPADPHHAAFRQRSDAGVRRVPLRGDVVRRANADVQPRRRRRHLPPVGPGWWPGENPGLGRR